MNIRDCKGFHEQLQAYLNGELDAPTREAMDQHARACPECAQELDRMTFLLTMCAELDEGLKVPQPAKLAWRAAVRSEAKARKRPALGFIARGVSVLAAAMVLLTISTYSLRERGVLSPEGALTGASESSKRSGLLMQYDEAESAGTGSEADGGYGSYPIGMADDLNYSGAKAYESDGAISSSGELSDVVVGEQKAGVVILRSASREIESTQYDADLDSVRDLVSEYEGYFELLSSSGTPLEPGQDVGRVSTMAIRVPSAQLDAFLTALDVVGSTTYRQEYAEDISNQYSDTQVRLDSYRAQLDQLTTMLDKATTVEDMIAIDDKMREVIVDIESLEGTLRGWDSRASYSSVSLGLTEVATKDRFQTIETTLNQRIVTGFQDSLNWLVGFLQDALVVLAMAAPQLVIIIPALVLGIVILRVIVSKLRRK